MSENTPARMPLRSEGPGLTCPAEKVQVYYTDTETPGLRLRVSRAGARVWDWRRGTTTKIIGKLPGVSYDAAAVIARGWNAAIDQGRDARAVVVTGRGVDTVADLFDRYIGQKVADATRTRKPNETERGCRSQVRPILDKFGTLPILDLSRDVIMSVINTHHFADPDPANWPVHSARAMARWVRAAWNWAERSNLLPRTDRLGHPLRNPASNLIEDERSLRLPKAKRGRPRGYKVDLSDNEVIGLMRGLEAARQQWKPGCRRRTGDLHAMRNPSGFLLLEFCLYTGCRKSEAAWLYQSDVADDTASVIDTVIEAPLARAAELTEHKTAARGGTRSIILTSEAQRVLALAAEWRRAIRYTGPLVFPSPTGKVLGAAINEALDTAIGLGGLKRRIVVHSLRSAYINYACRAGVELAVVSRNVGHGDIRTTESYYREVHDRTQQAGADAVSAEFSRLRVGLTSHE